MGDCGEGVVGGCGEGVVGGCGEGVMGDCGEGVVGDCGEGVVGGCGAMVQVTTGGSLYCMNQYILHTTCMPLSCSALFFLTPPLSTHTP